MELVRTCAGAISPTSDLERWYRKFSTGQATRLAVDLDIIDMFVERSATILEVGAVPLILTLALARQKFSVAAVDIEPFRFEQTISEHGLNVVPCNIETEALPFGDSSFD